MNRGDAEPLRSWCTSSKACSPGKRRVAEHHRKRFARRARRVIFPAGFIEAGRRRRLHPPGREQLDQNVAAGRVVVHDQDSQAVGNFHDFRFALGGAGIERESGCAMKRAAAPQVAVHPNTAVHQVDQSRRNRQPQPRAAESPRHRVVGLLEGIEDRGMLVRRDADARVADGEMDEHVLLRFFLDGDLQRDFPLLGELDRVAEQVDHHLPQPRSIAEHPPRDVRCDAAGQLQSLVMRAEREQLDRVSQIFAEVERRLVQLQVSGFDFREIEDIANHRQ